ALREAGLDEGPDAARRAAPLPAATPARAVFRREGELWTFAFQGEQVQLAELKGFRDLARLLAEPGRRIHAIELADHVAPAHDEEPVLDARARREAEGRIRALQEELEAAERDHDLGRAERVRAELDALVDELARSLGLGGRSRRLGSAGERARTAVTWRIRSAMRRLADAHPALGRHLENAVRTGSTCVYPPEAPVEWELSAPLRLRRPRGRPLPRRARLRPSGPGLRLHRAGLRPRWGRPRAGLTS
ncbi:MAG: hypothetical protein R3263_04815, partial [Myxococcota bacterium]|nr:hypothetical protein [Myxococcota bacterium]